jgi:23S rRNA (cytosine1962-C5)-methyltransferase
VLAWGVHAVRLKAKGLRRVMRDHPWVFDGDVVAASLPSAPQIVDVLAPDTSFVGRALCNPRSKIALRLLTRDRVPIDDAFVAARLEAAVRYRERVTAGYEAYRVVHSEADGLPGLTVDRYAEVLVVQVHAAALEPFVPVLLDELRRHYQPRGILGRNDAEVRRLEGLPQTVELLYGEVPEVVYYREGEVRLAAAPYTGQKTGAFLDQRENHVRAFELAFGRALDAFCYHGGFALQLARRAERVVAIDSSAAALEQLKALARENGANNIQTVRADAMGALRLLQGRGERFDVIVLDPPAFAKGRAQLPRATAGYKELNLRALKLLDVRGRLVTASCSHHLDEAAFYAMLAEAAADAGRTVRVLERRHQAACHPEILSIPETRYLKLAVLEVVATF